MMIFPNEGMPDREDRLIMHFDLGSGGQDYSSNGGGGGGINIAGRPGPPGPPGIITHSIVPLSVHIQQPQQCREQNKRICLDHLAGKCTFIFTLCILWDYAGYLYGFSYVMIIFQSHHQSSRPKLAYE